MSGQYQPILLLTRPEPASRRFAAQARERFGPELAVEIAPLMETVFRQPALPGAVPDGMIFTSETGAEAFSALTERRGRAICVGPRTAEVAGALGWQAEVRGGDAEGLVRELTALRLTGDWLHARGREAAGNLAGRLNAAGMRVQELIVYAQDPRPFTAPAAELLRNAPERVVIPVFSPRSARLLVQAASPLLAPRRGPGPDYAAISAAAAAALAPLTPDRVETAPTPDLSGMLAALSRLPGFRGHA